jgi:hypothetical protein
MQSARGGSLFRRPIWYSTVLVIRAIPFFMDKYAKAALQKRSNSCEFTLAARRGTQ